MTADWSNTTPEQLLASHLARPANSRRAYETDLNAFAKWSGSGSMQQAVRQLLDGGPGSAQRLLIDFVSHLQDAGLSPETARRRVGGLCALLRRAADCQVIGWTIKRPALPQPKTVRDTKGPSREQFNRLIDCCERRNDAIGARNKAICLLLCFSALRSGELLSIRYPVDVDLGRYPRVRVKPKGRWGRVWVDVALRTSAAIERWVRFRGDWPGPLFVPWSDGQSGGAGGGPDQSGPRPLSYSGLYAIIRNIGRQCGVRARPHGLRHTGISQAFDLTSDIGYAMALARHRDSRTTMAYLDRRRTMRAATEIVASGQATMSRFQSDEAGNDN